MKNETIGGVIEEKDSREVTFINSMSKSSSRTNYTNSTTATSSISGMRSSSGRIPSTTGTTVDTAAATISRITAC
jgi:hypothetical protein